MEQHPMKHVFENKYYDYHDFKILVNKICVGTLNVKMCEKLIISVFHTILQV